MVDVAGPSFRRALVTDVPVIQQIRVAVRENVLSNPARVTDLLVEEYLDELGRGFVAEIDGVVIGFSFAARADGSIWALFVRPEFEGRGAGKGLLRLAVDWLFGLGFAEVKLGTAAHTRADAFYQRQGWTRGAMKDRTEVWFWLARPRPCPIEEKTG